MIQSQFKTEQPLDETLAKEISETFHEADLTIIKNVIYFDGWSDYEESGGLLIFRGIDDSIQTLDFGYCVMAEDNTNYFRPNEVSVHEAQRQISTMNAAIKETNKDMEGSSF
jgi:hypothetical protein